MNFQRGDAVSFYAFLDGPGNPTKIDGIILSDKSYNGHYPIWCRIDKSFWSVDETKIYNYGKYVGDIPAEEDLNSQTFVQV
jgi:hypothetical protein